eukprot:NODE_499_length_7667_cov_0.356897.p2 type:complete len:289 gc:universal NODE_499_length_7667_cov_0.356897:2973-3839(+)
MSTVHGSGLNLGVKFQFMILLGSDLFSVMVYIGLKKRFNVKFMCKHCSVPFSDINIVASYGIKIPQSVVKKGLWINVHPSLLPEFRGPTPIEYSLLYGRKMGISLITLDDKMDCGELYGQLEIPYRILPYYQCVIYHAEYSVQILSSILPSIKKIKTVPQCGIVSYSKKLSSQLAVVDFNKLTSVDILKRFYSISHRYRLRAVWRNNLMFLDSLELNISSLAPGEFKLHRDYMDVGCLAGSLRINKVSRLTGKICSPISFFNGLRYNEKHGRFCPNLEDLGKQERVNI